MAKRAATSELNHDNWDKEEEPEEAGVFQKASSEVLETRVIRTAKRRVKLSDSNSDSKPSPFSSFTGFGSTGSVSNISSPFSFLSQNKPKAPESSEKNGTKQENSISSLTKDTQPQFKSFTNPYSNTGQQNDVSSFSPQKNSTTSLTNTTTTTTSTTFKPFEHIFKASKPAQGDDDKKSKNLELLKDLNLSCSSWISEHLEKNPYCILTPIFKDYEKHLAQLDLNTQQLDTKDVKNVTETSSTTVITKTTVQQSNSSTETAPTFTFKYVPSGESNQSDKDKDKEKEDKDKTDFKFGGVQPMKSFNFQFGNVNTNFSAPSPFSLNQIAAKPTDRESEANKDGEEAEEPPKNEFVPVVEEDSTFDIKCKVFTKKDGHFVSRGVGTLFLKPVKDSTKTQLVVRAHTNLGNILLNFLLAPGMPIQKTGKNNAMIVCVPTPEAKPPPIPVLIRVKTSEECDTLIKKLEECRG